jgi:hypothetical protein
MATMESQSRDLTPIMHTQNNCMSSKSQDSQQVSYLHIFLLTNYLHKYTQYFSIYNATTFIEINTMYFQGCSYSINTYVLSTNGDFKFGFSAGDYCTKCILNTGVN